MKFRMQQCTCKSQFCWQHCNSQKQDSQASIRTSKYCSKQVSNRLKAIGVRHAKHLDVYCCNFNIYNNTVLTVLSTVTYTSLNCFPPLLLPSTPNPSSWLPHRSVNSSEESISKDHRLQLYPQARPTENVDTWLWPVWKCTSSIQYRSVFNHNLSHSHLFIWCLSSFLWHWSSV